MPKVKYHGTRFLKKKIIWLVIFAWYGYMLNSSYGILLSIFYKIRKIASYTTYYVTTWMRQYIGRKQKSGIENCWNTLGYYFIYLKDIKYNRIFLVHQSQKHSMVCPKLAMSDRRQSQEECGTHGKRLSLFAS